MPLTFAHPALAVPLHRPLGRFGVLSALIIGSMAPDFVYFLGSTLEGLKTHTWSGVFWFCLPAGLIAYIVFHAILKLPTLSLFGDSIAGRLASFIPHARVLPRVSPVAVIVSLLLGSISHILWDGFTHKHGMFVAPLPVLQQVVYQLDNYPVPLYKLLQHISGLVGLALLVWWSSRWLVSASYQRAVIAVRLSARQRTGILVVIACLVVIFNYWALIALGQQFSLSWGIDAMRMVAREIVLTTVKVLVLCLLSYSIAWHLVARKRAMVAASGSEGE